MTTKSERTRQLVVDTALRLFRERGYEETTMRLIAAEAGVCQGSAYYYFSGKEALVHELYVRIQDEHRQRAEPLLDDGASLATNLRAVLHAGLDTMDPYHSFGSTMLHAALSRSSTVSPFSDESGAARAAAAALMGRALRASRGTRTSTIPARLPDLLWLAYLGVTLFWVTDDSPGQRRTRELVDGVAPIIARTIALSRLPVGRRFAADVFALVDRIAPPIDHRSTS